MGLFLPDFDTPGPGIPDNAPRQTGIYRVTEVLSTNGGSLFKAGFLAVLSGIPWAAGVALAVLSHVAIFAIVGGLLGGMIMAPQIAGVIDTALRALRDEPGVWWYVYKDAWKKNWKASLFPGALAGLVYATAIFVLFHMGIGAINMLSVVMTCLGCFVSFPIFLYIWAQIVLYEMSLGNVVQNAILMILRHPLRALGSATVQLLYWGAVLLFFPLTLFLMLLTGVWFPLFLGLFVLYKPMEEDFDLENMIREHNAQNR